MRDTALNRIKQLFINSLIVVVLAATYSTNPTYSFSCQELDEQIDTFHVCMFKLKLEPAA